MPLNDSDIDSDDNFHNDDSVNAVEDVATVPAMCRGVCVAGVKCTAGRQTEQLDEYQGPACAESNQITEDGDKLRRYSAILKFGTCDDCTDVFVAYLYYSSCLKLFYLIARLFIIKRSVTHRKQFLFIV